MRLEQGGVEELSVKFKEPLAKRGQANCPKTFQADESLSQ